AGTQVSVVRPRRRAPDHGSGGVITNVLWTFAPPNGLIVPNPDQFGNQSERRIARTRTGCSRVDSPTTNWREIMTARALVVLIAPLLLVAGCAATIHGNVRLVDSRQQPIPNESPKGAVVNMINTKAAVDQASASASVDEKGEFESPKDSIKPGVYKVEVSRIGYETQTETVEVGSFGKKLEIKLRRIDEAKRKSIKGAT